ncbi:membrane protein [Streptomyces rimosus subsp. rimosus]|nr:membrane protein [Streptomyces rimosus subsp. rimosus]
MKWAHLQRHGLWPLLANRWDSRWYTGIADHGYAASLDPSRFDACNLAFFPLYPVVVKAVAGVTPGSRATIGLLVAVGCSLLAAWGIYAVGERLHGRRVGTVLAVLWGATPVAAVQWMGYTESLFTALVAWSLYAVLTDRWVTAGALCLLAGLTRPTGVALVAAVCVSAVVALWRLRRTGPAPMPLDPDRNRIRRIVLGAVLAPLGWLAYVGWVGVRLGRADGYFAVQRQWRNEWDGGRETLRALRATLVHQSNPQLYLVVVSLVLIMSVVLFLLCLSGHRSLPLLVFSGVLLVVVLGSGGVYFPRARFLLPGFPLLLPLALALAGTRRRTAVLCLSVAALGSAYFGAYMLLTYRGAL